MLNRRAVWKKLKEEGVIDSEDPKVNEFITYMRDNPKQCWADYVPIFRDKYYATFDTFLPVLVKMKDPTVNSILVKTLDPSKTNELNILTEIADKADPEKDPLTFKRLALLGNTKLDKKLSNRAMPENIRPFLKIDKEVLASKKVVTKSKLTSDKKVSKGKTSKAKPKTNTSVKNKSASKKK